MLLQNEVKLLLELLPKYYAHVERYPHTLLIKFYGLHRVVPLNGSKVRPRGCLFAECCSPSLCLMHSMLLPCGSELAAFKALFCIDLTAWLPCSFEVAAILPLFCTHGSAAMPMSSQLSNAYCSTKLSPQPTYSYHMSLLLLNKDCCLVHTPRRCQLHEVHFWRIVEHVLCLGSALDGLDLSLLTLF